jgi:uncharacterized protein with FMN-binding domain
VKKIVLWLMSTVTAVVLLFGYHTSTSSTQASAGPDSSVVAPVQGSTDSGTSSGSDGSSAASSAAPNSSAGGTSGTVTGSVAQTRWGPVQVQLTVSNGKITNVSVIEYPDNNGRDQEINARALPILIQETLKAQSANIDMVSGATVTSTGYLQSLQAALDEAGR